MSKKRAYTEEDWDGARVWWERDYRGHNLQPLRVVKETKHTILVLEKWEGNYTARRRDKGGGRFGAEVFNNWAEAHEVLIKRLEDEVDALVERLATTRSKLYTSQVMEEPKG